MASNNPRFSAHSGNQERGTASDTEQLLQLQLMLLRQNPMIHQQQPMNQLTLSALLAANGTISVASPTGVPTASMNQNMQQQAALLALRTGNLSSLTTQASVLPDLSVSSTPAAGISYQQLLALAQLKAQQQQQQLQEQQRQQLIAQLLATSSASTPMGAPPRALLRQPGTVAGAPAAGAPLPELPAAAAREESVSPRPSSNTTAALSRVNQPMETQGRNESGANAFAPSSSSDIPPTNRPPIPLTGELDSESLNAYQCLLRQQIELFGK